MKNKILLIVLACVIIIIVFIGLKKDNNLDIQESLIECVMYKNNDGEPKINFNFEIHGNKETNTVNKVVSTQIIETDKKEILNSYSNRYDSKYKEINDQYSGFNYSIENKDNKLIFKLTIDYNKFDMIKFLTENSEIQMLLDDENRIKTNELKAYYEKYEFICN